MSPDKIDSSLHELAVHVSALTAKFDTVCERLAVLVEKHEQAIFGIEPAGLDKRTDRLEGFARRVRWGLTALAGAALTAIGTAISNYFPLSK